MSEERQSQQADDQVEDLDVEQSEAEEVKGGRKAGKQQHEYLEIKMEDVIITGVN